VNPLLLKRSGIACIALLTSACSLFAARLAPVSGSQTQGTLAIAPASEFVYVPARDGRITPDRIANTATTSILLKRNIDVSVRDAVASAWRNAGVRVTSDARLVLSARIEALSADDARSPAMWTLTMRYVITNAATRETVYASTRTVHTYKPKFTNNAQALADIVTLSVETLTADPVLQRAVE